MKREKIDSVIYANAKAWSIGNKLKGVGLVALSIGLILETRNITLPYHGSDEATRGTIRGLKDTMDRAISKNK